MKSSAPASSSPVLTPGRTAAFTAAMAPAVTSPEARMSSISCGVLIWIMRPLHFASHGRRAITPVATSSPPSVGGRLPGVVSAARGERAGGDLLDLADRVDAGQQPLALVEPGHGRRLFPVDLQPVADGLGLVVVALHHLAVDEHAPAGEPADQLLLVDDQLEHAVEAVPELGEGLAQLLGLGDGAGEAVEQEAGLRVRLGQ